MSSHSPKHLRLIGGLREQLVLQLALTSPISHLHLCCPVFGGQSVLRGLSCAVLCWGTERALGPTSTSQGRAGAGGTGTAPHSHLTALKQAGLSFLATSCASAQVSILVAAYRLALALNGTKNSS